MRSNSCCMSESFFLSTRTIASLSSFELAAPASSEMMGVVATWSFVTKVSTSASSSFSVVSVAVTNFHNCDALASGAAAAVLVLLQVRDFLPLGRY